MAASMVVTLSTTPAYAYTGEEFDENKIETWRQFAYPQLSQQNLREDGYGKSVGKAGCGYFSLTAAARKEGTVPDDYKPAEIVEKARENRMHNTPWGHFDFNRVEELNIGLKLPEITKFENAYRNKDEYYWNFNGNWETKKETIRKMWNAGYYILLCLQNETTRGHYVFVDYVDDNGRIRITDSGFKGTWLDEAYHGGFSYGILLESEDGRPANKQFSVYGDFDENSTDFNKKILEDRVKEVSERLPVYDSINDDKLEYLENYTDGRLNLEKEFSE